MTTEKTKEFEVSFMYGVESLSTDIIELTDDLENLILDIVATTVLTCAGEAGTHATQWRQRSKGAIEEMGVVRIRYPEYGEITSMCESW